MSAQQAQVCEQQVNAQQMGAHQEARVVARIQWVIVFTLSYAMLMIWAYF